MADWEEAPAFVIDSGSGIIKSGFAGEEVPRAVFQGAVAYPRGDAGRQQGPFTIGDAALQQTSTSTISYPISHGIVVDWDGLERLWRHAYSTLSADPTSQAVLVTEAPMNPKANREKMTEVLFESFGVPAMHVQIQAVLSLYSVGRTEGCVLDSGDGITHTVPVYDGHTVPTAIRRVDIAGRDLTEWLMQLLSDETQRPFTTSRDREVARDIKEKLCYVADDFEHTLEQATEYEENKNNNNNNNNLVAPYQLPDGTELQLARSLFCCPEALFDPTIIDHNVPGIQHMIHGSINDCGIDIRRTLYKNIVLSGGNTMFRGLETRLTSEVKALANNNIRDDVKVIAPNERKFSVWMGAAILCSLTSFSTEWVTKEEYEEHGCGIVHRRCNAYDFVEK